MNKGQKKTSYGVFGAERVNITVSKCLFVDLLANPFNQKLWDNIWTETFNYLKIKRINAAQDSSFSKRYAALHI